MTTEFRRMMSLRGTTAEWAQSDIVLLRGEIALEDTGSLFRGKVGDGTRLWSDLPYSFEVDNTARGQIASLQLADQAFDARLTPLEALPSTVASNTQRLDVMDTTIAGKQDAIGPGFSSGDLVVWDGTGWSSTVLTLSTGGLLVWNGTGYVAVAQGTTGQVLTWDSSGLPRWKVLPASGGGGVEEAPIDGLTYARKDATWESFSVAGTSAAAGEWAFSTAAPPPGSQEIALNNVDQTLATSLTVSYQTNDGLDTKAALDLLIRNGSDLLVQNRTDAALFNLYRVTADPTDSGSFMTVPVVHLEGGTPILDGDRVLMFVGAASGISQADADLRYINVGGDTMTGALLFPAGSAAAPGVAFSAETTMGMYRRASGQLGFSTSAGEAFWLGATAAELLRATFSILGPNNQANFNLTRADSTSGWTRFNMRAGGMDRWRFDVSGAESTGNAGNNLTIQAFDDTGTLIGNALQFTRSTQQVGINGAPINANSIFTVRAPTNAVVGVDILDLVNTNTAADSFAGINFRTASGAFRAAVRGERPGASNNGDLGIWTGTSGVAARAATFRANGNLEVVGAVIANDVTNIATGTHAPVVATHTCRYMVCSAACVVTIPSDATSAFPIGAHLTYEQGGTGVVSFVAGAGAVVNVAPGFNRATNGQWSVVQLKKVAADTWTLFGNLDAV